MAIVVPVITTYNAKGLNKAIRDFQKLEGFSAKAGFGLRGIDQAVTGIVTGLAKAGAAVAVVGGVLGTKLVGAAMESQQIAKATEQIVKTTGGAANITAQQVGELSDKLAQQIGVDDELIQQSANLILTFKQIQNQAGTNNDIFTQTLILSQDLGHLFGSASGAAMQLGKALSDPERGMTALRKAGINFTESQKEQIKALQESGDLLGAQKLVLAEVRSQVGGLAEATATDFGRMQVAVGNVAEKFGFLLLPVVERLSRFIINYVVPYFEKLAGVIGSEGIGGLIKTLASDFIGFTSNLEGTGAKVFFLITGFIALKAAVLAFSIATTVATVAMQLFKVQAAQASAAAAPIALIVALVVALAVGVIAAYLKFEKFRTVVNYVINSVIEALEMFINFFIKAYNSLIDIMNGAIKILNMLGFGFKGAARIGEVSFGRIGAAANKATANIFGTLDLIQKAQNAERKFTSFKKFLPEDFGAGSGGAVETAKQKFDKYFEALRKVKDETKGVGQATKSLSDAQKGVLKATQDVTKAQDELAKATTAVETAEKQLDKVRKGLGSGSKESKDAADEVAKAQRELEGAGYSLEDATFAVTDAEKALADLRADATTPVRALREAEINLARAKIALVEAQVTQRDSTKQLSEAQREFEEVTNGAKEGSDRLKDALDAVDEAKKAQIEASAKLLDAQEKEVEATDKVTEANERLRDAKWELFDAEKALAELRKQVGKEIATKAENEFNRRQVVESIAPIMGGGSVNLGGGMSITPEDIASIIFPPNLLDDMLGGGFGTLMANGGVVTKATRIIAGEAGAEAIIPLDRFGSMGSTYNISVNAGMGADGKDIGTQIVNALKRYERTNGALPLTVA